MRSQLVSFFMPFVRSYKGSYSSHEHYDTVTVVLSSNNNNFHQPTSCENFRIKNGNLSWEDHLLWRCRRGKVTCYHNHNQRSKKHQLNIMFMFLCVWLLLLKGFTYTFEEDKENRQKSYFPQKNVWFLSLVLSAEWVHWRAHLL